MKIIFEDLSLFTLLRSDQTVGFQHKCAYGVCYILCFLLRPSLKDFLFKAIVTLAQFWLSGKTSFLICRALLGFIQGGFIPDLILYMSCRFIITT